jgi:MFS family permease
MICAFGSFSTVFAMTLMLPFLPLYIEELGVKEHTKIIQWSGIAYSAMFISAGLIAPVWGKLGDLYGRKAMLIRASFGMTVMVFLMGFVSTIGQLITCLLIIGLAGGYSSGSTILIATQTPKEKSGWALSIIASSVMGGSLLGPLAGGYMPMIFGIRPTFWSASVFICITFFLTLCFLQEKHQMNNRKKNKLIYWKNIPNKSMILCMLFTGFLLTFANLSIEPILPLYVGSLLKDQENITKVTGIVLAVTAFGSILSATYLGRLADKIGHQKIIIFSLFTASILLIPQAFVTTTWQLIGLRFLMGISLGGLLPCIASVIRHSLPETVVGTVLGFSISAQFFGQFLGPLLGGFAGSYLGFHSIFICTSILLLIGAISNWKIKHL